MDAVHKDAHISSARSFHFDAYFPLFFIVILLLMQWGCKIHGRVRETLGAIDYPVNGPKLLLFAGREIASAFTWNYPSRHFVPVGRNTYV